MSHGPYPSYSRAASFASHADAVASGPADGWPAAFLPVVMFAAGLLLAPAVAALALEPSAAQPTSSSAGYFHRDPWCGRNDWEPAIAIVRGLLQNPKEGSICWGRSRAFVMPDNAVVSQAVIHELGELRDARGIPILRDKLARLGRDDVATQTPLYPAGTSLEWAGLEALAKIGGAEVAGIIDRYRRDPGKDYLHEGIERLHVAAEAYDAFCPLPPDYPEPLKNARSIHDQINYGDLKGKTTPERAAFRDALQALPFPGVIEYLSGDGRTTTFRVETPFVENVHDFADPFTDMAIYRSDPKVEYPVGRRRWAISHTFLSFPIPDGDLYAKEYTWNVRERTITTHFHEPVDCETVSLNPDGRSVTVSKRPISTGIELRGNVFTKKCSSAVRGVWDNPEKKGRNYYVRRANILTTYKALYYFRPHHTPIVNQYGVWMVDEAEHPERFFDQRGDCIDVEGVIRTLRIPLHQPKILAGTYQQYEGVQREDRFTQGVARRLRVDLCVVPGPEVLDPHLGARFEHSRCGHAGLQQGNHNGYRNGSDINSDGVIDGRDQELLRAEAGNVYRANVGDSGYFGYNWLSTGWDGHSRQGIKPAIYVCSYDYGAGYEPDSGIVRLHETPPTKRLYVEYHYDAPPAAGERNIKVYLHPGPPRRSSAGGAPDRATPDRQDRPTSGDSGE